MTGIQSTLCVSLVLSILASVSPAWPQSVSSSNGGSFDSECARRDLKALDSIEELGETEGKPPAWLAAAGQMHLQARIHCLAGDSAAGIALYDRIIAGDVRLAAHKR